MVSALSARSLLALSAAICLGVACGGSSGGGGGNSPTTTITTTAGNGQTGTVGQALGQMLQVTVMEDGAPKANATVDWTSTATGASFAQSSTTTDGSGVTQTLWTLGTVSGPQTAKATVAGTSKSVTFTATANPGPPANLAKSGGDNQSQVTNQSFGTALAAKVADQFGNGVPGITVDWAVTGGSLALGAASTMTNGQGVASVGVAAGGTAGAAQVEATSAAVPATTLTFNLMVTLPPVLVSVGDIFFQSDANNSNNPATDNAKVGQPVRWHWVGAFSHSVRSLGSPSFTSSTTKVGVGQTYEVTFNTPGVYSYDCAVHGSAMSGTVTVTP